MKHRLRTLVTVGLLPIVGACGAAQFALDFVQSSLVTVKLINESLTMSVEATVVYDDHGLLILVDAFAEEDTFLLPPGDVVSFTKNCDEITLIEVDDADLLFLGFGVADTGSGVLRQGIDFECGDEISFVFTHSDAITDFDVHIEIR